MGSWQYSKKRWQGKVETPLDEKLKNVEWGEFKLGDLFDSSNGDFDIQKKHINNKGKYVITAGLTNNGVLGKTDIKAKVFEENTITIDMFGNAFYRSFKYKMVTHARVFSLKFKFELSQKQGLFLVNCFHFLNKQFGYENMCSWEKIKNKYIQLPTRNGEIDFEFMEEFIAEIEKEHIKRLEAYLEAGELEDYNLTEKEKQVLAEFESGEFEWGEFEWGEFNLKKIFGKSSRGKRLKSDDRVLGNLPFVTAGESNEGVSGFIGNNVTVFSKNTVTIDMFGSAKYRNYEYGADDHVTVVHTENLPKFASIFITSAIHKSSYTGEFHYGKNFYPKDADNLNISLPIKNQEPDYELMETLISAIQKMIIKDVVLYTKEKLGKQKA